MGPVRRRTALFTHASSLVCVLIALISLWGVGCTRYIRPDHLSDDPLFYLARIASRHDVVDRLALDIHASMSSSVLGLDADAIVVARRPRELRVEVLTPTDDLLAMMTANATTFVHYERGSPVCYTGPPCLENTARLLPIPVEVAHLVEFLLGGSPLLVRGVPTVEWDAYDGFQTLRISQATGAVQRISFDPCDLTVRRVELFQDGVLQMRVENDLWAPDGGVWLPMRVRLEFPEQNLVADVSVRASDPWMAVDSSAFVFECPPGAEVVYLPCPEKVSGNR